jgi:CRISPR/Cas system CSM-associated protein Csm2 small subunit
MNKQRIEEVRMEQLEDQELLEICGGQVQDFYQEVYREIREIFNSWKKS